MSINNDSCFDVVMKQLAEHYNYGLYYPPANGRAGKFLDEERCMSEYPLPGSVGRLEVDIYHCYIYVSIAGEWPIQRGGR